LIRQPAENTAEKLITGSSFHSPLSFQLLLAEDTYDKPSFERRAVAGAPG
jgi:hypothetical protein